MSIAASNAMHADDSVASVFARMNSTFDVQMQIYDRLDYYKRRLTAAEIVRGSVARVLAHRLAMQLAPGVTQLLEGDDGELMEFLQDPIMGAVAPPHAAIRTDFGRIWYGDDARLLLVTGSLMQSAAAETVQNLPGGLRAGMLKAGIWVSQTAAEYAHHRNLTDRISLLKHPDWSEKPRGNFVVTGGSQRRSWHDSLLLDELVPGVKMSARDFLVHNTEAATEHIVAFLTDVFHGFLKYPEATADDQLRAVIAKLHMSSVLAYMTNQQNAEAEYMNRYVDGGYDETGVRRALREPLVMVSPTGAEFDIAPNPASKYIKASRRNRQRCPGPDPLAPIGAEVRISDNLRGALKQVLHGYSKERLALLDRNYSEPDVIAALGAAVGTRLQNLGYARFDDVAANLRPAEMAVSTGAFILQPPNKFAVAGGPERERHS